MESNSDTLERVRQIFEQSAFIQDLGIRLKAIGPGWCETTLAVQPRHTQQDAFIHAGVQATMADHTAGGAAGTLNAETQRVLTIEFKVNLLRPAVGRFLRCRAEVLRAGQTVAVVESSVFTTDSLDGEQAAEKLVSKATVTLAVIAG